MAVTQPVLDGVALERLSRLGGSELVRQMLELYLTNGPERVRALQEAAAGGDAQRVERAAHTLKSSAGNVGATRLQQAAESLEVAAAASGAVDVDLVLRLIDEYAASEAALRQALERLQR